MSSSSRFYTILCLFLLGTQVIFASTDSITLGKRARKPSLKLREALEDLEYDNEEEIQVSKYRKTAALPTLTIPVGKPQTMPNKSPTGVESVQHFPEPTAAPLNPSAAPASADEYIEGVLAHPSIFEFPGSWGRSPNFNLTTSAVINAIKAGDLGDLLIMIEENNFNLMQIVQVDGELITLSDLISKCMPPSHSFTLHDLAFEKMLEQHAVLSKLSNNH